jgi:hypothetical protein
MIQELRESPAPLLNIHQLSELTGLSLATLNRLQADGAITYFQPGGKRSRVLFPADAIQRAGASARAHQANVLASNSEASADGQVPTTSGDAPTDQAIVLAAGEARTPDLSATASSVAPTKSPGSLSGPRPRWAARSHH